MPRPEILAGQQCVNIITAIKRIGQPSIVFGILLKIRIQQVDWHYMT